MERIVKRGEIIRDSWALLSVSRRETTLRGVVKMDKKKKKKKKGEKIRRRLIEDTSNYRFSIFHICSTRLSVGRVYERH